MEPKMNTKKMVLAAMLLLMGAMATETAFAWYRGGPRVSIGFGFGPYYGYPYYYPPYAYYPPYYPAPVVVQRSPVYVEQPVVPQAQPQQLPSGSWYYCGDSGAYYPYVQECAGGWQRVSPTPHPG
jgi:hypothetical protein